MAQTACLLFQDGEIIEYATSGAITCGDVIAMGNLLGIAVRDAAASSTGEVQITGGFKVPKITGAITQGAPVYWKATADPVTGTAGTGAAQAASTGGILLGVCAVAAASGDSYVATVLTPGLSLSVAGRMLTATVAAAGSVIGDAAAITEGFTLVTAADDTKGVILPVAAAGMQCIVKSSVSNKILKVWPQTGATINAISASTAISLASGPTIALFVAYSATAWYTLPLLPS